MTDQETIKEIQEHLEIAMSLTVKMQAKESKQSESGDNTDIPSWAKDRLKLWALIYIEDNGNPIEKKRGGELWVKMGKDKIGTAGFFTGKRASLQRTIDGRVTLTPAAERQTQEWAGKSLKEYAKQFKTK